MKLKQVVRRKRQPIPSSKERAPFANRISKASRRNLGRVKEPAQIPAFVRVSGVELREDDLRYIRRKLGMKLGKFADSIERVSIRLEDINGPRGGVDQLCRIKVMLIGLPTVIIEKQAHAINVAVDGALDVAQKSVRREVQRRRTKPIKRRHEKKNLQAV